jgi:hypothetical protein
MLTIVTNNIYNKFNVIMVRGESTNVSCSNLNIVIATGLDGVAAPRSSGGGR